MKCPYCGKEIAQEVVAKELGRRGGQKSRRTLTSEQSKAMNKKRWGDKKQNHGGKDNGMGQCDNR